MRLLAVPLRRVIESPNYRISHVYTVLCETRGESVETITRALGRANDELAQRVLAYERDHKHRSTVIDAARSAVASPLLETSVEGARSILLSITGSPDISLWEVNEAAKTVSEAASPDANIIFGAMVDDKLEDQVWITVVATGFGDQPRRKNREDPFSAAPRLEDPLQDRARRREPEEPRVTRNRPSRQAVELDVPEFMPRR